MALLRTSQFAAGYRAGRVGEKATHKARPTLPSSNRRCRFPASGSPENSRLRHAQDPKDAAAPDVPSAVATTLLAEVDTAAGCGAPNAGRDGPEHSVQSRSRRSLDNQRKSSSPSLANVDSAPQSERGSA